jgi:hypothetical protein
VTFSTRTLSITMLCHYGECHDTKCHVSCIIMMNVIMLIVIMLSVVMLSVVAPKKIIHGGNTLYWTVIFCNGRKLHPQTSKLYRLSVVMKFPHNFCGIICSKVFSLPTMIFSKQKKFKIKFYLNFYFLKDLK